MLIKNFFYKKWTRDLNIESINGKIGGTSLEGAQRKLEIIKSGKIITTEVC